MSKNVRYIEKRETKFDEPEKKIYSDEFLNRQEKLKQQYQGSSSNSKKKSENDDDTDFMRLG